MGIALNEKESSAKPFPLVRSKLWGEPFGQQASERHVPVTVIVKARRSAKTWHRGSCRCRQRANLRGNQIWAYCLFFAFEIIAFVLVARYWRHYRPRYSKLWRGVGPVDIHGAAISGVESAADPATRNIHGTAVVSLAKLKLPAYFRDIHDTASCDP